MWLNGTNEHCVKPEKCSLWQLHVDIFIISSVQTVCSLILVFEELIPDGFHSLFPVFMINYANQLLVAFSHFYRLIWDRHPTSYFCCTKQQQQYICLAQYAVPRLNCILVVWPPWSSGEFTEAEPNIVRTKKLQCQKGDMREGHVRREQRWLQDRKRETRERSETAENHQGSSWSTRVRLGRSWWRIWVCVVQVTLWGPKSVHTVTLWRIHFHSSGKPLIIIKP